jgi:hypothetical protein
MEESIRDIAMDAARRLELEQGREGIVAATRDALAAGGQEAPARTFEADPAAVVSAAAAVGSFLVAAATLAWTIWGPRRDGNPSSAPAREELRNEFRRRVIERTEIRPGRFIREIEIIEELAETRTDR